MTLTHPVIVVPGITATNLRDEYPLSPDFVWSQIFNKEYERITLHPDNLNYEAVEPSRVLPDQVFDLVYKELINELRYNLKDKEDEPVPVFAFPYDWRMPLAKVVLQFSDFVGEVVDRTRLMRHYHNNGYDGKVNLVGHSMGGLIIAGYLAYKKTDSRINKIATLATPFGGSFEAIIKITTGTANLGATPPGSREREMARITPALYHLLPDFDDCIVLENGNGINIFDPKYWQPSIISSIAEIIRLRGLPTNDMNGDAAKLFSDILKTAEIYKASVNDFTLQSAGLDSGKWMAVAGAGTETRVRVTIRYENNTPLFVFNSDDRKNLWEDTDTKLRYETGDGTVPLKAAVPKFLNRENIIVAVPDDFGYWEFQDKLVSKASGFHGMLPNMDMLHRLIVRFFKDAPDYNNNTWGRPLPGVTEWHPPIELRNKNSN
jgi:pimeloyl-ACP methyl ester carboxylesterase